MAMESNWDDDPDTSSFIHAVDTTTQVIVERRRKGASMIDGRYLKGALLGEGSYGKVKEMLDVETLSRRAVKILSKRRLRKIPNGEQNVEREIQVLRHLHHKNITELIEVFYDEEKRKIYMVMEYCVCPLQEMLEACPRHTFPIHQAHDYFCQMIEGLSYLHSQRVIHKDIKPGNLLLSPSQLVKICDFGVAEQLDLFSPNDIIRTSQGSPAFQPPEVAIGKDFFSGFKLDVWAAGVTLYNFVSGQYPFMGETIFKLFEVIGQGDYKMPEGLSEDLQDLIRGMLAFEYEDRMTIDVIQHHRWVCSSHPLKKKEKLVRIPPLTDYDNDPLRGLTCLDALLSLHQHDLPQSAVLLSEEQMVSLMNTSANGVLPGDTTTLAVAVASLSLSNGEEPSPMIKVRDVVPVSVGSSSAPGHDVDASDTEVHLPGQVEDISRRGSTQESPLTAREVRMSRFHRRSVTTDETPEHQPSLARQRHSFTSKYSAYQVKCADDLTSSKEFVGRARSYTSDGASARTCNRGIDGASPSPESSAVGRFSKSASPWNSQKVTPSQFQPEVYSKAGLHRTSDSSTASGTTRGSDFELGVRRHASLPVRLRKRTVFRSHRSKRRKTEDSANNDNGSQVSDDPSNSNLCRESDLSTSSGDGHVAYRPRRESDPGGRRPSKKFALFGRPKSRKVTSASRSEQVHSLPPSHLLTGDELSPAEEEYEPSEREFTFPSSLAPNHAPVHSHSWAGPNGSYSLCARGVHDSPLLEHRSTPLPNGRSSVDIVRHSVSLTGLRNPSSSTAQPVPKEEAERQSHSSSSAADDRNKVSASSIGAQDSASTPKTRSRKRTGRIRSAVQCRQQ